MPFIVSAASIGTIIDWYDFYIYGSLGAIISRQIFDPNMPPALSIVLTYLLFSVGFAIRPLGAVVFGRIGDYVGRKYAFLVTLLSMGLATALIGVVPPYVQIGIWAPIIVAILRIVQGLALGGEYGGAAIYVAEHAPDNKRGFYTSFIQTTATIGLWFSLLVILGVRYAVGLSAFNDWGWRIPFLLSLVLVVIGIILRWKLAETPIFMRLKETGRTSKAPLREALLSVKNWKLMLIALFGAVAGQAVVWYTGQFVALYYLQNIFKVPFDFAYLSVAIGLMFATPFFVFFGWLSDRIGRKKVMMTGMIIAAATYYPIYMLMGSFAAAGNFIGVTFLVFIMGLYVTMVYGPIAAFLVELFPARIRYTSLSVPYHLGNGEFGGWTLTIIPAINYFFPGNPLAGLLWPISVALMTFIVGMLLVPETKGRSIWEEVSPTGEEVTKK